MIILATTCSLWYNISKELMKMRVNYRYSVGEIVNGYEIVEQTSITYKNSQTVKSYICKCLNDGYINNVNESNLTKGSGCPVCSNRAIMKGANDLATTRPDYIKYIVNKEDTHKYGKSSNKKVMMVCPDCKTERMFSINMLDKLGKLPCKCSDGISYPNKFVMSLLEQLGIKFNTEKRFKWLPNRYYDFYIKDLDLIIEAHGEQHYVQTNRKGGRSLEEETKNDKLKKDKAIEHDIENYIVIDCRTSEREFVKASILKSGLPFLLGFDESDIDWSKCDKFALGNYAKHVCKLWDSGEFNTTTELCDYLGVSKNATRYLKKGTEYGWCHYDGQEEAEKIIKQNAGKNTSSLAKYRKENGAYWQGRNRSEDTKEKLRAANIGKKWTDETKEKFIKVRTGKKHTTKNKIICGGIIYESYSSCAEVYGIHQTTISNYLKGKRKMPKKFTDLGLSYYKD